MGNAMVDVFAEVPEDFCKHFGLHSPVQHVSPEITSAILAALPENKVITSGGCAANTAKIAARLGLPSAFAGAVGNDQYADYFEKELADAGVILNLARKKSPTGVFISLRSKIKLLDTSAEPVRRGSPSAETRPFAGDQATYIAASPSAALEFDAQDIKGKIQERAILYLEGFLLKRKGLLEKILELVNKHNLTLAIDFGTAEIAKEEALLVKQKASPFWDEKNRRSFFPLILFLNEREAEVFAGTFNSYWEDLFSAAIASVSVIVKRAEKGAAIFSGGNVFRVETKKINAMESTGSGDAFAAGFLTELLRGGDPRACGESGNAAAALVLNTPGTSRV